jgi:hypothetical protein
MGLAGAVGECVYIPIGLIDGKPYKASNYTPLFHHERTKNEHNE